jgi:hypothetical protein
MKRIKRKEDIEIKKKEEEWFHLLPVEIVIDIFKFLNENDIRYFIISLFSNHFKGEKMTNDDLKNLYNNIIYSKYKYKPILNNISNKIKDLTPNLKYLYNNIHKDTMFNIFYKEEHTNYNYIHIIIRSDKCEYCNNLFTERNKQKTIKTCSICSFELVKNLFTFDNNNEMMNNNFPSFHRFICSSMSRSNIGLVSKELLGKLIKHSIVFKGTQECTTLNQKINRIVETRNIRSINDNYFILSDVKRALKIK